MKKTVFLFMCAASAATMFSSCEEIENIIVSTPPSVSIELAEQPAGGNVTLVFTVSDNASGFQYALGTESDMEAFMNGTMDGTTDVSGNGEHTVILGNLAVEESYTVYALAYDEDLEKGPVAIFSFGMSDSVSLYDINITTDYITSSSAAVYINPENYWYRFDYALGKAGQKEMFENGTIEGLQTRTAINDFTLTFFNIEDDTDYILYLRAWNRYEECSETIEYTISTAASGDVPEVSMEIVSQNIYEGTYTFTPNNQCGKFGVVVCEAGDYDGQFFSEYGYDGDVLGRLLAYMDEPSFSNPLKIGENGAAADFSLITPDLIVDAPLEAFILLYTNDGEPFGVQKIPFSTPAFDATLGTAEVTSINFTSITPWYCPFEMTVNEHTVFTFWAVFTDSEWESVLRESEQSSDQNFLAKKIYEKSYDSYSEKYLYFYGDTDIFKGSVGYDTGSYYVAFAPTNGNGPVDGGWGEIFAEPLLIQ